MNSTDILILLTKIRIYPQFEYAESNSKIVFDLDTPNAPKPA